MARFDPSYDMGRAQRMREETLACIGGPEKQWQIDARNEKAARNARYVALRLTGLSDKAAFEQVVAEVKAARPELVRVEIAAYEADNGDIEDLQEWLADN